MKSDTDSVKTQYIASASKILTDIYEEYKDKGILAIYFWGSITRDDWNPEISDIDTIAIVDRHIDLSIRTVLSQRMKAEFPYVVDKFGIQFYGIDELNDGETLTILGKIQPPGYLLLRFNDWIHVAGKDYQRSDFRTQNFTPTQAREHQLAQAKRALQILAGELPMDEGRSSGMKSMAEDAVKGAIGALYWEAVGNGHNERLNYDSLPSIVVDDRKELASKLVDIRRTGTWVPEAVLPLRSEIESLD